jgi:hypothetical protein
MDYEPLTLADICNAGIEIYAPERLALDGTYLQPLPARPPVGSQLFHGLPFQIGSGGSNNPCFIAFGDSKKLHNEKVVISLDKTARHIIFAHAVLETNLWQGGEIGVEIARYKFKYSDGREEVVPIRERFEIGNIPLPWGQFPFLCVPDQKHFLEDRHTGNWARTGFRLTEVGWAIPRGYFIWPWKNPHPEARISSIEIQPGPQRFLIAAITLSNLEENPLLRQARRPVKISILDSAVLGKGSPLEVEVDRGVATYTYTLSESPLDEVAPEMAGFGAPQNPGISPAYAEIAANPSATLTVTSDEKALLEVNWARLEKEGTIEAAGVRLEIVDPGRNWVSVHVVDGRTGETLPCRIAFHSPDGIPYPPHGHHAHIFSDLDTWNVDIGGDIRLGQIAYAYIDGTCQGWLPRGRVLVDIACGYEYEPIRKWVDIEPGQQHLTLQLDRWIDMNAEGYFSGDTHVHFLSSQGASTEAQAEGLNVVNLLQSQWGHLYSNTEEFTGRPQVAQDGKTIVYVSQENRQHILGHISLLGLKNPVMPWASGGPSEGELGGSLEVTLSHWADAAHEQGGIVILPHIPTPNGETAALIATERLDAVEMLDFLDYEHREYYRYLNGGYRLPLVGGTDKMSSNTPVGLYRTYVQLEKDQPFNYDSWCQALKKGRTFLSGGPMLWLTVDGKGPGAEIQIGKGATLKVEATARSIFPLHSLQIINGGKVVAETVSASGSRTLKINERLNFNGDSWIAARCAGPSYQAQPHFDARQRGIMAHTSPVYLVSEDGYRLHSEETFKYMITLVSGSLEYIRHRSPQYPENMTTHFHGLPDHMAELERPFMEALSAIHSRMHELGIPH